MITKDKLTSITAIVMEYSLYAFALIYPYATKWGNAALLVMCAGAFLSGLPREKFNRLKQSKGLLLLPCYFILLAIGVGYSDDFKYSMSIMERSLMFLGGPLLIAAAPTLPAKIFERAAWILTFNTTGAALYCIIQNIIWFKKENIPFSRFFDWEYTYEHLSNFVGLHPTYFSMLILVSIYFLIFLPAYRSALQWIGNVLLIGFLITFLVMLGTKIGLLILFLFGNVALIVYLRKKKKLSLIFGYVAFNVLVLVVAFNTHVVYWRFRMAYETLKNTLNGSEMSDYRILHWKCAVAAIRERPFFGWGTGDSYVPLDRCYNELRMPELVGYNAHNQFFETWIKIGLPGVIILVLIFLYPLYKSVRNRHYLFISIFAMFFLVAFTESLLNLQKGIALFTIIYSVYLGHICITDVRTKDAIV